MNNNNFHILVVDDDNRIRDLVKQYLEENKFIVTTAKDSFEAKEKIKIIKFVRNIHSYTLLQTSLSLL